MAHQRRYPTAPRVLLPAAAQVWITRTEPGASGTAEAVRHAGFTPVVSPLLKVNPAFVPGDVERALESAAALAFTSPNGAAVFASLTSRRDLPVFAVGDRTAQVARNGGFTDIRSAGGDVHDLVRLVQSEWASRPGDLVVPIAAEPAADLAKLLAGRVPVRTVIVYETIEATEPTPAAFDAVLFHSRRAADIFARRFPSGVGPNKVAVAISSPAADPLRTLAFADLRTARHADEVSVVEALGKPAPRV